MNILLKKQRFSGFTKEPSGMCLYSEGFLFVPPSGVVPYPISTRVTDDLPAYPPKDAQGKSTHLFRHVEVALRAPRIMHGGGTGRRVWK